MHINDVKILEAGRDPFIHLLRPDRVDWMRTNAKPNVPGPNPLAGKASPVKKWRALWRLFTRQYHVVIFNAVYLHTFDQNWIMRSAKLLLRAAEKLAMHRLLFLMLFGNRTRLVVLDAHDHPVLSELMITGLPRIDLYGSQNLASQFVPYQNRINYFLYPLPLNCDQYQPEGLAKDIDIFFSGWMVSQARIEGKAELMRLKEQEPSLRVEVSNQRLAFPDFLRAIERSWLVFSAEGLGWQCNRHYESLLLGAVPIINRPKPDVVHYLVDGDTCFFYNPDVPGDLSRVIRQALQDKEELRRMAAKGRQVVLKHNHTLRIAETLLHKLNIDSETI